MDCVSYGSWSPFWKGNRRRRISQEIGSQLQSSIECCLGQVESQTQGPRKQRSPPSKFKRDGSSPILFFLIFSVLLPRYVRVNTIKSNISNVIETLVKDYSLSLVETECDTSSMYLFPFWKLMMRRDESSKNIFKDKHVPNLLILPPNFDLHDHKMYLNRDIILQVISLLLFF